MSKRIVAAIAGLLVAATFGCGSGQSTDSESEVAQPTVVKKAIAWINPKSGSELAGSAIFINDGDSIELQVSVEQAPPGMHAVHIHENGDCSSDDGKSAGGHWNPTGHDHGKWGTDPFHLGDIGNLEVGADGAGSLTLTTDRWTMGSKGPNDILEKSVIVHEAADDFTTQPTGAAGGRIGCGVIKAQ